MAEMHEGARHHRGRHIGKPMAGLLVVLGLLVIGSAYYLTGQAEQMAQTLWGIIGILAGIVLWMHHAKKE